MYFLFHRVFGTGRGGWLETLHRAAGEGGRGVRCFLRMRGKRAKAVAAIIRNERTDAKAVLRTDVKAVFHEPIENADRPHKKGAVKKLPRTEKEGRFST